jgi:hypothetical protein
MTTPDIENEKCIVQFTDNGNKGKMKARIKKGRDLKRSTPSSSFQLSPFMRDDNAEYKSNIHSQRNSDIQLVG